MTDEIGMSEETLRDLDQLDDQLEEFSVSPPGKRPQTTVVVKADYAPETHETYTVPDGWKLLTVDAGMIYISRQSTEWVDA